MIGGYHDFIRQKLSQLFIMGYLISVLISNRNPPKIIHNMNTIGNKQFFLGLSQLTMSRTMSCFD